MSIVTGIPTHLLVNVTDLEFPGQVSGVQLVSLHGEVLMEVPAVYFPDRPALYNLTEFVPPDDFFFLKVCASIENYSVYTALRSCTLH